MITQCQACFHLFQDEDACPKCGEKTDLKKMVEVNATIPRDKTPGTTTRKPFSKLKILVFSGIAFFALLFLLVILVIFRNALDISILTKRSDISGKIIFKDKTKTTSIPIAGQFVYVLPEPKWNELHKDGISELERLTDMVTESETNAKNDMNVDIAKHEQVITDLRRQIQDKNEAIGREDVSGIGDLSALILALQVKRKPIYDEYLAFKNEGWRAFLIRSLPDRRYVSPEERDKVLPLYVGAVQAIDTDIATTSRTLRMKRDAESRVVTLKKDTADLSASIASETRDQESARQRYNSYMSQHSERMLVVRNTLFQTLSDLTERTASTPGALRMRSNDKGEYSYLPPRASYVLFALYNVSEQSVIRYWLYKPRSEEKTVMIDNSNMISDFLPAEGGLVDVESMNRGRSVSEVSPASSDRRPSATGRSAPAPTLRR